MLRRVRIGSGTLHCAAPLHIVRSLRIVLVPLLSCVAVFVVGGECGGWTVSRFPFSFPPFVFSVTALLVCVCVFVTGLCHCGMVVVICVGQKGGVRWGWCLALVHCSLLSSSSSFVGGVRGSARAALRARTLSPNTIVSFLVVCFVFFLSLSLSPFFFRLSFVGMAVCVYHVLLCCVGMTAIGSLSRSSSFFW